MSHMPKNKINLEGINIFEIGLDLKRSISRTVRELPETYSLLIIVKTKKSGGLVSSLLDLYINDKKQNGLYISTNKSVEKIINALKKEGRVKTDKLCFVDCMTESSKMYGNIYYCPPQNLTDLNLAIGRMLDTHEKIGFVVFDSLSTLFIYNETKPVEKFVTTLLRRFTDKKINGIFITTKTTNNAAALEDLSIFFDEVLTLNI